MHDGSRQMEASAVSKSVVLPPLVTLLSGAK